MIINHDHDHLHLRNLQYGKLGVPLEEIVSEGLDLVVLEPQVGKAWQRTQQVAQRVQAKVVVTKLPGEDYHEADKFFCCPNCLGKILEKKNFC